MRKKTPIHPGRFATAGLVGLSLAGCATYGAGDYGYYGDTYPSTGYQAPYGYGQGSVYSPPHDHGRGQYSGYGWHNGYGPRH